MTSTVRSPIARAVSWDDIDLADAESMRVLLRGDSVIDWQRLHLARHADVDRFLRVNEFDPKDDIEMQRFEGLRADAVDYLTTLGVDVPKDIAENVQARDLFLIASGDGDNRRWACVVLKVMHIIHHLAGRETLLALPVSDDAVFRGVEFKVMSMVEELRAAGHPVVEFAWSRKSKESQITKLLAKRENLAARIYDRLRFRLVLPKETDVAPTLIALARHLLPFNYTIPGESVNTLLDVDQLLQDNMRAKFAAELATLPQARASRQNDFSAPTYRIVNFVADMPLRVDSILNDPAKIMSLPSHVVFVQTEYQVVDARTAAQNEQGESAHSAYKGRQTMVVKQRLFGDDV